MKDHRANWYWGQGQRTLTSGLLHGREENRNLVENQT